MFHSLAAQRQRLTPIVDDVFLRVAIISAGRMSSILDCVATPLNRHFNGSPKHLSDSKKNQGQSISNQEIAAGTREARLPVNIAKPECPPRTVQPPLIPAGK